MMKSHLYTEEKFHWPQYINGSLLRQIYIHQCENFVTSGLKLGALSASIDGKYIALTLNQNSTDCTLVVLERRIDMAVIKRKEKKNIDTFLENLFKNNKPSPLPGSFVQSFKGKAISFFSVKELSKILLFVITANGFVNIWSAVKNERLTWEHLLSFAMSDCYSPNSFCNIPSQKNSETVLWLESSQRNDPIAMESNEGFQLRRVIFEYSLGEKTIKLSAPTTLLDISKDFFCGGIQQHVFAGGMWLVPTLVGTHCSITAHLFFSSRTISMDIPILQPVNEKDVVVSFVGHSDIVSGSNIYVIVSSYLYRIKYSESDGLQCQSFPINDVFLHGNAIQTIKLVLESDFGLVFCAVLNNGSILMCRIISQCSPLRPASLIYQILEDAVRTGGASQQGRGICIIGDTVATSCRGFTVYTQQFLLWNGYQVYTITPSSPSSWADLDIILSHTFLSKEGDEDTVSNIEIMCNQESIPCVRKPTPIQIEDAHDKNTLPGIPQYLLNLLDNLGSSLYLSDSEAEPPQSQLLDLTEEAPLKSDTSMEEFLHFLQDEERSNLFSAEFIGDELKLTHPRHKHAISAQKESALPGGDIIVNLNTQAAHFTPDSKDLVRDIDLSEKHWLDALDIATLFPTSRTELRNDGANLAITKYVDCFQLPRILEGLSGALKFPSNFSEHSTKAHADNIYCSTENTRQSGEKASHIIAPADSFEVLFHRILFGSTPTDLYSVVLELMDLLERHLEIALASALLSEEQTSDKNVREETGSSDAMNEFSVQSERSQSDLESSTEFAFSPMYPLSSNSIGTINTSSFQKLAQPSFDVGEDSDDGVMKFVRTRKGPMPSAVLYNENLAKLKVQIKAKPNFRDMRVKSALEMDDEDGEVAGSLLSRRRGLQSKDKYRQYNEWNQITIDPYHIDIIQRSCMLASNVISSHINTSKSSSQQQNLTRDQEDSILRILLRGGRRVEAAEALALWNRPYSLYLLCIRVAASSNVICAGFNIDANNESCCDPRFPSMQSLSYYQNGRGQNNFLLDLNRKAACPLQGFASDISEWTTTYGRRWSFDTSCLDELNQLSEEPKLVEHSSWQSSDFGGMHGSSSSFATASSSSIGHGQEFVLGSTECDMDAFSAAQVRMLEAHQVFEKTLIYFLTREGEDGVEFLISLFDFRPLSLPIPTIASIYDKNAHISIKRACIWEKMIEKA